MPISFSGMSSGIDTQSIISALVSVESSQQTLLANQQSTVQQTVNAYSQLVTKLTALSSAAGTVGNTSAWVGTTATSSSAYVTATSTGTVGASLTFNVTKLAAAHTLISSGAATSTSDIVASSGQVGITANDGTVTNLSVGTGSLSEVVAAINNSDTGLVASAVQVSSGQYRLQVGATTTGANSTFTMSGLSAFTGMNVLTQGSDAAIHVGDATTGYDAGSTTNTFSNLVPGLSFTVSKQGDTATVSSTMDGTAVAKNVSAMVDAANTVLSYIDSATSWDSSSKTASPLNGESSVQQLQQNILSMISSAGAPGIGLTSSGRLTFDQTAFTTAFKANPNKVAAQFGSSTGFAAATGVMGTSVTFSSATSAVRAGSYAVNLSQAATREQWSVPVSGGSIAGLDFALSQGPASILYTAAGGESLATSISAINGKLAAAGLGIVAQDSGTGAITFTATRPGSSGAFDVALDGTEGTQLTAGKDVAGTIDGQTAHGQGDVLSLPTGTGGAVGLTLVVDTTAADIAATGGAIGSITYSPGLAQQLQQMVTSATNATSGSITSGQNSAGTRVKDLQTQIDNWTQRLTDYRASLVKQFTAMETSINTLKSSLSALSGLISSSTTTSSSSSG